MIKNENSLNNINNSPSEEKEAFDLKRKGESILNPGCCLDTLCSSRNSRYNKSCNLFQKSADKYKSCFQWRKAAECYEKCAEIKLNLKESPIKYYQESITCYQNANSEINAKRLLFKLNDYLEKNGEFLEAGKNCENVAIKFEKEKKYKDAIFYYIEAIKYYEKDIKNDNQIINLKKKLIELIIIINGFPNEEKYLIDYNEEIGINSLKNNLSENSAHYYFGKAILSVFYYKGINEAELYINKYKTIDQKFESSYIYKLCFDIINDFKINNVNKLYNDINKYKSNNECDAFMINILKKIENKIKI